MSRTTKTRMTRRCLTGLAAGLALLAATEKNAEAQEILLTGPLAGAPAVRKLRLYREGRFQVAPTISFTLLDEYKRQIMPGLKVNYNLTDWLAVGVWGSFGGLDFLNIDTGLATEVQDVNATRRSNRPPEDPQRRLTAVNLGPDFTEQTGTYNFVLAPQITAIPFRGKLALFQSVYVDTDLYFSIGPAIIGSLERGDCEAGTCTTEESFERVGRTDFAPTFALGFSFYINKWNSIMFEYRGLPFKRNTGGFDNRGGDPDGEFPDLQVNADDREFKFNQMLTLGYSFFFPQDYRVSE